MISNLNIAGSTLAVKIKLDKKSSSSDLTFQTRFKVFHSIFCQKPNFAKKLHQRFHEFSDVRPDVFISRVVMSKTCQIIADMFFLLFFSL